MKKIIYLLLVVAIAFFSTGCNSIKKALNKGLNDQEQKETLKALGKKIGKGVVAGATERLASDTTKMHLDIFSTNLSNSINNSTRSVLDSLFKNDVRFKGLVAGVLDTLNYKVDRLFTDLSERDLKRVMNELNRGINDLQLANMVKDIRSSLIGEEAIGDLMSIRDSLLGAYSKELAKQFVHEMLSEEATFKLQNTIRTSLDPTIDKIFDRVDTSAETSLNFAQNNINQILLILALLICGILFFNRYQKTKYTKLVKNITHSIEHMDDNDSKKQLKKVINKHATKDSVEPLLRKILKDQGIVKEKKKKEK